MASIQLPPGTPEGRPNVPDPRASVSPEVVEFTPVLLAQLQDDLARSRLREAFWISVIVHILAILAIALSPKFMPQSKMVNVATAEDLIRNRELTFLELPQDQQKPPEKAPDTKFMSDKNRIATSRTPSVDKKVLDELREARRPGSPEPPAPPVRQQEQRAQSAGQPAQQPQGAPQQSPPQTQQSANASPLSPPPITRPQPSSATPFGGAISPGTAIAEAARSTARGGYSGTGEEFSISRGTPGRVRSDMDVLSDTMGVDFAPYLSRVRQVINSNWQNLIPEVARPPLMKRGKVSIEFAILKDGRVAGMRVQGASGDVSLDRAAWAGITASNPFPPLPGDFRGPYLALRCHFYYNPDRNELQ